jgi:hypothetical protein
MGHQPGTNTLVKYHVGKHDETDVVGLMLNGNVQNTSSISVTSNPALFRIKDVSIYNLTKKEIVDLVDNDPDVISIITEREELKKKYEPLQRNS